MELPAVTENHQGYNWKVITEMFQKGIRRVSQRVEDVLVFAYNLIHRILLQWAGNFLSIEAPGATRLCKSSPIAVRKRTLST